MGSPAISQDNKITRKVIAQISLSPGIAILKDLPDYVEPKDVNTQFLGVYFREGVPYVKLYAVLGGERRYFDVSARKVGKDLLVELKSDKSSTWVKIN